MDSVEEGEPLALPGPENINKVVAHRPALETVRPGEIVRDQDFTDCAYHPAVEALIRAFSENNFVQPFDWNEWQLQAQRLVQNPLLMQTATLKDCVKLVTTHIRKERFCSGHFGSMVACGHVEAILRRLEALQGGQKGKV